MRLECIKQKWLQKFLKKKARKLTRSGKAQIWLSGRCRECFTRAENEEIEKGINREE
jgi:hypothetical protein